MPRHDLTTQRFGKLLVVSYAGVNQLQKGTWHCVCDCGGSTVVTTGNLRSGNSTSCGCAQVEHIGQLRLSHGHFRKKGMSPTYVVWHSMVQRCTNPNVKQYKDYGGRGIAVCERWLKFENFLADMGERPVGKQIDRINNDGNYEPGNCRWVTAKENNGPGRRRPKGSTPRT